MRKYGRVMFTLYGAVSDRLYRATNFDARGWTCYVYFASCSIGQCKAISFDARVLDVLQVHSFLQYRSV